MLRSMAAFKQHAAFGFWKGALVVGNAGKREAMGHLGRITAVSDLPSKKVFAGYISKAAELNDAGVKIARAKPAAPKPVRVPADLAAALKTNVRAQKAFAAFRRATNANTSNGLPSRRPPRRARSGSRAIARIDEGKSRNWKYESRAR